MTSKFEQLIEYVINDEEAKAKELFHDIVVEKSREIYENLMNEEELDEESDAERDDHAEKAGKKVAKDIEYDELHEEDEEELDENMGMGMGEEELITDVETEEEGISMEDDSDAEFDDEAEKDGDELTHDMEKDHDEGNIEDRVVDLEDKLDELMAEFESLMGDGIESDLGGEEGDEVEGDAMAADDTMAFGDEESMMENITLAAAPKPTTTEPAGTNTKSTVAFNSGAAGMASSPVKMTGDTAQGRPAPKTGELIGKVQNTPASGNKTLSPATKPVTTQAAGVNTKTPFPKG
jgi:hypothetical protein